MHVVTQKKLQAFWSLPNRQDAERPLRTWCRDVEQSSWRTPADIKEAHRSASFLANNRVVFNIAGNKYRLVTAMLYNAQIVLVRFVGTHKEYDDVDAETI